MLTREEYTEIIRNVSAQSMDMGVIMGLEMAIDIVVKEQDSLLLLQKHLEFERRKYERRYSHP